MTDGGAAELANHAQTLVAEFTGPAVFVLRSPTEFQIERGEATVGVSGQTPVRVHAGRIADKPGGSIAFDNITVIATR